VSICECEVIVISLNLCDICEGALCLFDVFLVCFCCVVIVVFVSLFGLCVLLCGICVCVV